MHRRPFPLLAAALLVAVLVVTACAPRAGSGPALDSPGAQDFALDLPALLIDFDSEGQPALANTPLALFGEQFGAAALQDLALPADVVQLLTDSSIQHIQLSVTADGLLVLVNGRAIPSLKWDGGELANTTAALDLLGANLGPAAEVVDSLLPVVRNLGVGVIARFPAATGVAGIPLQQQENGVRLAAQQWQESFLESIDSPPTISVPIVYDAQGSWRIGDLTYAEWISLTGMPIFDSFRLKPQAVDRLIRQGITEFAVYTDVDGIHVSINGNSLPYIGWADGELSNALALAEQAGVWERLEEQGMDAGDVVAMLETILPVVQATEITVTAYFPEAIAVAP